MKARKRRYFRIGRRWTPSTLDGIKFRGKSSGDETTLDHPHSFSKYRHRSSELFGKIIDSRREHRELETTSEISRESHIKRNDHQSQSMCPHSLPRSSLTKIDFDREGSKPALSTSQRRSWQLGRDWCQARMDSESSYPNIISYIHVSYRSLQCFQQTRPMGRLGLSWWTDHKSQREGRGESWYSTCPATFDFLR